MPFSIGIISGVEKCNCPTPMYIENIQLVSMTDDVYDTNA